MQELLHENLAQWGGSFTFYTGHG